MKFNSEKLAFEMGSRLMNANDVAKASIEHDSAGKGLSAETVRRCLKLDVDVEPRTIRLIGLALGLSKEQMNEVIEITAQDTWANGSG